MMDAASKGNYLVLFQKKQITDNQKHIICDSLLKVQFPIL